MRAKINENWIGKNWCVRARPVGWVFICRFFQLEPKEIWMFSFVLFGGGFLMDVGQVTSDPAYLRRRSREQLGLMRSRLTSCRRAIHRLPTPSLRCRRCNTGCNTGRPGHPARHRSSMSRSKKLLPRNIFFFFLTRYVHAHTHTHTHEPQFRTIVKFRQKCRCFDIWFKSTRTTGRISSKHKREKKSIWIWWKCWNS